MAIQILMNISIFYLFNVGNLVKNKVNEFLLQPHDTIFKLPCNDLNI